MKEAVVIGGRGFVGRHVAAEFESRGYHVIVPPKYGPVPETRGIIVYAAGPASDYRENTRGTFAAHVADLLPFLGPQSFSRFVYISSTRVYDRVPASTEETPITVAPGENEDVLAISKLAGEALTHALTGRRGCVVRLANAVGIGSNPSTFLHSIIASALSTGTILLRNLPESARDYIVVKEAASLICTIAERGKEHVYNVASGKLIENGKIAAAVAKQCGASVRVAPDATLVLRKPIDIARIRSEFFFIPAPVEREIDGIIASHRIPASSSKG